MGKASRGKWLNRLAEAKAETIAALQATAGAELRERTPPALRWFRAVGLSSFLLGEFGLMQMFFLTSVLAVYSGLAIVLLDLFLQKFERASWLKWMFASCILAASYGFTVAVVMRPAPLDFAYGVSGNKLTIVIMNDSPEDDYESLDFKIVADDHQDYFMNNVQTTQVPGVWFADPIPSKLNVKGESLMIHTKDGAVDFRSLNILHLHCDRLAPGAAIRIQSDILRNAPHDAIPYSDVKSVVLTGRLKGKFRVYELEQDAQNAGWLGN